VTWDSKLISTGTGRKLLGINPGKVAASGGSDGVAPAASPEPTGTRTGREPPGVGPGEEAEPTSAAEIGGHRASQRWGRRRAPGADPEGGVNPKVPDGAPPCGAPASLRSPSSPGSALGGGRSALPSGSGFTSVQEGPAATISVVAARASPVGGTAASLGKDSEEEDLAARDGGLTEENRRKKIRCQQAPINQGTCTKSEESPKEELGTHLIRQETTLVFLRPTMLGTSGLVAAPLEGPAASSCRRFRPDYSGREEEGAVPNPEAPGASRAPALAPALDRGAPNPIRFANSST